MFGNRAILEAANIETLEFGKCGYIRVNSHNVKASWKLWYALRNNNIPFMMIDSKDHYDVYMLLF